MNVTEARTVLAERLAKWRPLDYSELAELIGTVEAEEVPSSSGAAWYLEYVFFWDGDPGGDVRVQGYIDDGGLRAYAPVVDSFIKSPDGRFVDEE